MPYEKGKLPKAYLRIDPQMDEHPEWPWLMKLVFSANRQPWRGRFREENRVRRILRLSSRFDRFKQRRDITPLPEGGWYLEGWDEWQEGDFTVAERMKRLRDRRARNAAATVTPLRRSDVKGVS